MQTIESKSGLLPWNIVSSEIRPSGKKTRSYFTVACSKCGYEITSQKGAIQNRSSCPGCSQRPAAVKIDQDGKCITICEFGMVEFIKDHQETHNTSEREAVRYFIDTVKANLPSDDPIVDTLTEDSVNAKVRRATGKKKDCVKPPQNNKVKKYRVAADPEAIQKFLDKHLPGYRLVEA